MEFMIGQTMSADENGETIYHDRDVENFISKSFGVKGSDWD